MAVTVPAPIDGKHEEEAGSSSFGGPTARGFFAAVRGLRRPNRREIMTRGGSQDDGGALGGFLVK